jgi:hypothetical protein
MKTNQIIIMLSISSFLLMADYNSFAQRVVVKTPRRTVVHGARGTAVYRAAPPVVRPVYRVPASAVVVRYRNLPYYYHGGVFYVSRNGTYVRVASPVGIRVAALPAGYVRVVVGPSVYFYAGGVFYVQDTSGEYAVCDAPVGATVSEIPADAAEVEIGGKVYYEYNGILYKPIKKGKSYEVVGKLEE